VREPISRVEADRVEVRGHDLTGELMGSLTFTEYFHLLLTGRRPTDDERYFLDLLLVAIAEHGMMPSNVAARMTLAADPGSLHGAVAAGVLGAGPVLLGTSEGCAVLLRSAVRSGRAPVEIVSTSIDPTSPSFISAPCPKFCSICLTAACSAWSRAFASFSPASLRLGF